MNIFIPVTGGNPEINAALTISILRITKPDERKTQMSDEDDD
jgi:hypothetical protein